jgi:GTP-binding protein
MHGRTGTDIHIHVPLGIVVYEENQKIGEILTDAEQLVVARGGRGGRGNARFVSPTNQAPRNAEEGMPGTKKTLLITLKLISDIGIVGLPNAGKSTLLKAMTDARPRIASFPFTTLSPNLGVLRDHKRNVVIADMPGIIEGAHKGKGIGLQFLRHIERTNLLILLIDISVSEPRLQYELLLKEFKQHNPQLLTKPRIVVFNKIDLRKDLPQFDLPEKVFYVSALKNIGLAELVKYLKDAH